VRLDLALDRGDPSKVGLPGKSRRKLNLSFRSPTTTIGCTVAMESNKVTAADLTLHIESEGLKEPLDGRIKGSLQNVSSCGAESLFQWVRFAAIVGTLRGAVDEAAVLGKEKPRWDEGKAVLRDGVSRTLLVGQQAMDITPLASDK
jgi:hypothetical protein